MTNMPPEMLSAVLLVVAVAVGVGRTRGGPRGWVVAGLVGLVVAAGLWAVRTRTGDALHWTSPWCLPVVLAVVLWCVWRAPGLSRGLTAGRRRVVGVAATVGAVAAALAAAGPTWGRPVDRLTVVLAVDRSRSMDLVPDAAGQVRAQESAAARAMRGNDRIARVGFGTEAMLEEPVRGPHEAPGTQTADVGRDGSDMAAGVRRALAEVPEGTAARVLVITDGAANRGDAVAAAMAAAAAGVPVDTVTLARAAVRDLRVDAVRAPASAAVGETVSLHVVTQSTVDAEVNVTVRADGAVTLRGRARVHAGEDALTLRQTVTTPGLHRYEVDVTAAHPGDDGIAEDNRGGTFVRVQGAASVLILEGDPGASGPLAGALRHEGFRVDEGSANGFPEDMAALAAYDLVVLSDVPARALSPEQLDQLRTYVRDLGGGLWLMGGDRSLGPGGYARTPVEEISPVSFDLRQERRRASLSEVLSIDYSGSMTAMAGGRTKIQLANEAAARSAMILGPGDRLGVAHVDTTTAWTIPLGPLHDLPTVVQRIRAVGAGGGGIIVPVALRDGYEALSREHTGLRHLLLFADGADAEEIAGTWTTVAAAWRTGITTSVVSLGVGGDTPELEHLAREGHGRFYLVEDAQRLPTVFAQETVLASRASLREENFIPRRGAPDLVTRGVDMASAPPLRGYVVTLPRPRASVLLTGPDGDPVLATWQVGVGHVAAFTSDAKDRWGAAWLAWPGASQLWVALARSLVRQGDGRVQLTAVATAGVLHVRASATGQDGRSDSLRRFTARVTGPAGHTVDVPLDPTGEGGFGADVPLARPGAYTVTTRDETLGAVVATTGALSTPGEELRPPEDPTLLARVAALSGGRMRASAAGVFNDRVGRRRTEVPLEGWLHGVAMAGLLAALSARRLGVPEAWRRSLAARARTHRAEIPGSLSDTLAVVALAAARTRRRGAPTLTSVEAQPGVAVPPSAPAVTASAVPPGGAVTNPMTPRLRRRQEIGSGPGVPDPADAPVESPALPPTAAGLHPDPGGGAVDTLLARKRARRQAQAP